MHTKETNEGDWVMELFAAGRGVVGCVISRPIVFLGTVIVTQEDVGRF